MHDLRESAGLHQAFDHTAKGDEVVPVSIGSHLLEEFLCELEIAALVCGVDQSVVREVVGVCLVTLAHGLVDQLALLKSSVQVEHLQHGGVEDGVHLDALVLHHSLLHDFAGVDVLILNTGFQKCSIGEFVYFNLTLDHVDVKDFHAFLDIALVSVGFDQDTKGDLVGLNTLLKHQVVDFQSFRDVSVHDAHVHDAVIQHAVNCDIVCLQLV